VGLVEVRSQIQAVRSHRRLRARVVSEAVVRLENLLPRLRPLLAQGSLESWNEALSLAIGGGLATEAEIVEAETGRSLLSRPTTLPVATGPSPAERALGPEAVKTEVAQSGPELRVLSRVAFDWNARRCVLRLASPAPDLVADLRDRQQLFVAHLLAWTVLALAAALAVSPRRESIAEAESRALDAYEEAMGRLRDQGEARSRAHEVERRRMEEQIQDKEAMARAGELTAGMVHEVRNGLGTIVGYARFLERGSGTDSESVGRHIREECETLEVVVRRFMDFVKRESLQNATFDLARMLSRVAAREGRGRPGPEVELDLPESLEFAGDEELLERAFENLVRNARDAAGERGSVRLHAEHAEDVFRVTVTDNGPGIPEERLRELRPFFTTKPGGLGLGLPIAYKIVHLHGGTLRLQAASPRGLMVLVDLPAPA
jgi:signal transduction histidine kinase